MTLGERVAKIEGKLCGIDRANEDNHERYEKSLSEIFSLIRHLIGKIEGIWGRLVVIVGVAAFVASVLATILTMWLGYYFFPR